MVLRSLPPRAQNPLQPLLCHLGLRWALWAACRRSCSRLACHLVLTWWTCASPPRTRGLCLVCFPFRSTQAKVLLQTTPHVMLIVLMFRSESEQTEIAIQTDLPLRSRTDTTRSLGRTTLLKDTVIRGEESKGKKLSPKTAVLLALSRPSRPITRSQSQVTVSGESEAEWNISKWNG